MARAQDGDTEAYGLLFNRFHDEVYRFAARRLNDPQLGQDVAAETFADAFRSIGRFRPRGAPFEAWLYTIARRRVADARRAPSRRESPVDAVSDRPREDDTAGLLTTLEVRELLDRLNERDRDVLELRFMEDLDVEQTARRLGMTAGAVRVAQHRALDRLRRMMDEGAA